MKLNPLFLLVSLAMPVSAQYAGPAILSRGEAPAAMAAPEIRFRPFLEIGALYDTGLAGVAVTEKGDLANQASYGLDFKWGVSGVHSWRRTKLGLEYSGSFQHYHQRTFYDSINESLMLGISHQLTRRATLTLKESAGIFSRDFGLMSLPQTVPFDPSTTLIPTTDFFDNRTIYVNSEADLTLQKTARLSFDFGGMGATVRRRSSALYNLTSAGAHGDFQYRVSRRTTIGAEYFYNHFQFARVLGGTDLHGAALTLSMRLSRWLEFSGYGGAARIETKFLQRVPVSPVIATLFGITYSSEIVHSIMYEPSLGARLSRTFQRGVAYISAGHTVTPGNGLFLTSTATNVFSGYTYTGLRRWSFSAQGGYQRSESIGNVTGSYGSESGAVTVSRQLVHSVHFIANYQVRRYESPDFSKYNRLIHNARIGLGFAPGDIPLRIW